MNTKKTNKQTEKTLLELWKERNYNEIENYNGRLDYHEHNYERRTDAFGVELELKNYDEDTLYYLPKFLNKYLNINCEYDGSLSSDDMELISQPYSKKEWVENKEKIYELFELFNYEGLDSNSETGLHIHISKELIGDTEDEIEENINKLYLILENYKDLFKKFSRRQDYYYCNFLSDKNGDKAYKDTIHIKNAKEYDHYHAINYDTARTNTIELRFFQSTTDAETFLATLQLAFNLAEVVRREDLTTLSFNDIVNLHKEYNELINYCNYNGIKSNIKIVDKTNSFIIQTIRRNKKVLRSNYKYHNYRKQIAKLINSNNDLITKDYEYYQNYRNVVNSLSYIYINTEDYGNEDTNNLYYIVRKINEVLSNYTIETTYDLATGRTKQKRTFNKENSKRSKELLDTFIDILNSKGGVV